MMPFTVFLLALAFFHCSEFCLAWLYNRETLGWRSWLFSKAYCVAMLTACLEYGAELRWAPFLKTPVVSWLGLAAVVGGELLRKVAMITAGPSFTHLIQHHRRPEHRLVTSGVYAWVRHPGYAGWMLWSVGTQLLLCNPLCTAAFAVTAWRFFVNRIPYEDATLVRLFGEEYLRYKTAVPSGVPFIS